MGTNLYALVDADVLVLVGVDGCVSPKMHDPYGMRLLLAVHGEIGLQRQHAVRGENFAVRWRRHRRLSDGALPEHSSCGAELRRSGG